MSAVKAWAAPSAKAPLERFEFEFPALGAEEVEIAVEYCGICHTDIAFINNEWGTIPFPLVPGHEITGRIVALGAIASRKGLTIGQKVGVGWNKESCGHCDPCLNGDQNLCVNLKATIWGNHGGWADRVRAHWVWTLPIPEGVDTKDAGPLMCAGITVFAPLLEFDVKPTDHIGVFGIGGLGHLAVQFADAWGAQVTAFSSSPHKYQEIKSMGADNVVSSRNTEEWEGLKGKLDLILITVAVPLDWDKIIRMLSPKGRLHFVGIVYEAVPVSVISLLIPQASLSASPGGSRGIMDKMLRFAALHKIAPITEHWPMSKVNEAIAHLESGKAAYRIILDADF